MGFEKWGKYTIDDVCTVTDCLHKTAPTVDYETQYRMLRTTNIRNGKIDATNTRSVTKEIYLDWTIRGGLEEDDVILTREAPMGEVGIIKNEPYNLFLGQRLLQLKVNREIITPDFLYYSLQGRDLQHQIDMNEGTGSVVSNIRIPVLKKMEIQVPNIEIQDKITKSLRALDNKIEINEGIIINLEQLVQTLFKHWFVDFEFPNANGEPYKSSGGEMVESELGMIPKGWRLTRLDEITVHSKKSFNPKKENVVDVAHFSLPSFDQQEYPLIENSGGIKSNKYYIDNNSVMFSKMNPSTPRVWLPNIIDGIKNICSTEFVVLDTSLQGNKSFIYSLTSSLGFTNYLINNATGSTNSRQRVIPTTAIAYKFPYEEDIVAKYEALIQPMFNKLLLLREENQKLISLRDTLLPKLLSGEIELPDETEVTEDVPIP